MGSGSNLPFPPMPIHAGYQRAALLAVALTQAALTGTGELRPSGCYELGVVGTLTITGGAAVNGVTLVLEGSNDDITYFEITRTATAFTVSGQVQELNALAASVVNIGRFAYLRVRAINGDAADPTFLFSLAVRMQGIRRTEQNVIYTWTLTKFGGLPEPVLGTTIERYEGSRFATAQCNFTGTTMLGATVGVWLQGSPDGGTTWITLASTTFAATGQALLEQDGETLEIDLSVYTHLRTRCANVAGAAGAYTCVVILCYDQNDWAITEPGSAYASVPSVLDSALVTVRGGAVVVVSPTRKTITFQVEKFSGAPLLAQREVRFVLSDVQRAGVLGRAANAFFQGVGGGVVVSALGTNEIVVRTSAIGSLIFTVDDIVGNTVYLSAVEGGIPKNNRMVVALAPEVTLVY